MEKEWEKRQTYGQASKKQVRTRSHFVRKSGSWSSKYKYMLYVVVDERDSTMLRYDLSWNNHGRVNLFHSGS